MSWFKKRPYVIERLDVRPGETLVVKVPMVLTYDQSRSIKKAFEDSVPKGVVVLVVEGGIELAVVRSADA